MTTFTLNIKHSFTEDNEPIAIEIPRGDIRVNRVALTGYSGQIYLEYPGRETTPDDYANEKHYSIYLDIPWIDTGVVGGTDTSVSHFLHLQAGNVNAQSISLFTGGLEFNVENGLIPKTFNVHLKRNGKDSTVNPKPYKASIVNFKKDDYINITMYFTFIA